MSAVVFERAGASDIPRAMSRAEAWLVKQGCTPAARSIQELQFVVGASGRGGPLRLVVEFSRAKTRFVFTPAAPGVAMPAESELSRYVDGAVEGEGALPPKPAPPPDAPAKKVTVEGTRCFICASVLPVGATECPLCGMAVR